jgi:hypothetical protein
VDNRKKIIFWGCLIAITAICWIDYQYLSEGTRVYDIDVNLRQAGHLIILLSLIPIGYAGMAQHPKPWLKQVWLYSYIAVALVMVLFAGLERVVGRFPTDIRDIFFYSLRTFFTSPLPYLMLYMIAKLGVSSSSASNPVR